MTDKMNFQAEVSKLLDIVVNSLYSDKQIFLRELISNASDACDKLRYLALTNQELGTKAGKLQITVLPDDKEKTLVIQDNGIGMNKEDLINHLGTIAKSGTADFLKNAKENGSVVDLIGQFGVGFYSAFMVANKVEVLTKKAGEEKAYLWTSNGVDGYEIVEAEKQQNGTEVKLFLKENEQNYVDTIYLRHIIRTYSDHIAYPIVLALGEAGEETINTASALWAKHKSEVTEEQYKEFYHHISKNFDDPWLTLHFKAEGNMEYSGLVYVPSTQPYDLFQPDKKKGLKLYVNKVFISDKVDELVPNYLRFVVGVVDSADLPLNLSREMLQQSPLIAKIKQGTVSRLLKDLKKRSENYEDYKVFWDSFGTAFKEGLYEDFTNRDEIATLSRFYSTFDKTKLTSFDEYISRIKGESKAIYYITGDDLNVLANNPQLEAFAAKGIEVLLLTDPIDEFWTQVFKTYQGHALKHISQADEDLSFEREGVKAEAGSLERLLKKMEELFKEDVSKVVATEKLTKSPASLTVEDGQMSIHLERLMKGHQQQIAYASSRVLEINPYNPLIIKLSEMIFDPKNTSQVEEISRLLLDQAKIAEGEPVKDPSFFADKLSEYLLKAI
ncbi:MAG: molecular chaperone HtpG [Alphaproteobacteria bacterium]|nr:molecular chaperone HtpG [Alphaproteobacteria bacterium]